MQTDQTKNAILEAAQFLFATRGYTETGVRDIAERANVNPALIARYFGSKLELFERALEASLDVTLFIQAERENFGEKIAEAFCASTPDEANVVPALVFSAGDSAAREAALRLLKERVIAPLEQWFGGTEASERAVQLLLVVAGFFTFRQMLPLDALAGNCSPAMRRWLATTLQEILDR